MRKSEYLFFLIKSMTQNEKRYFRMFASMQIKGDGKQNKYVELFDEINRLSDYDEKKITKKLVGHSAAGNISVEKKYLYNMILKSLRNFHSGNYIECELREMLNSIQILFEKGLYLQCINLIDKAQKQAEKFSKYAILLELRRYRHNIYLEINTTDYLKELFTNYYEYENENLAKLKNINEYNMLERKLYYYIKLQDTARKDEDIKEFTEIMRHPLLKDANQALSIPAKFYFYSIKFFYSYYTRNEPEQYAASKQMVEILEKHPEIAEENPKKYIYSISNHIHILSATNMGNYDEAFLYCSKLKSFLNNAMISQKFIIERMLVIYVFELNMYSRLKKFNEGIELIHKIENEINNSNIILTNDNETEAELFFYISKFYLENGMFKKGLYWNNKLINMKTGLLRIDLINMANILNLIIHYELKNYDLLRYRLVAVYRFLIIHKTLYKMEKIILDFIKALAKNKSEDNLLILFTALKYKLIDLSKDPFEAKFLEYFDFIGWIDKKMSLKKND